MKNEVERIKILPDLRRQVFDDDAMLFEFLDDCALAIGFAPSPAEVVQGRELGSDLLPGEVPVGFGYELPIDSDVLDPLRENANWNAADVNLARGVGPSKSSPSGSGGTGSSSSSGS